MSNAKQHNSGPPHWQASRLLGKQTQITECRSDNSTVVIKSKNNRKVCAGPPNWSSSGALPDCPEVERPQAPGDLGALRPSAQ